MTHAVCVHGGAMRFGAFVPCGEPPRVRRQMVCSLVLSDHNLPVEELREISRGMVEEDRPHSLLPPGKEADIIATWGVVPPGWIGELSAGFPAEPDQRLARAQLRRERSLIARGPGSARELDWLIWSWLGLERLSDDEGDRLKAALDVARTGTGRIWHGPALGG